MTVLYYVFFVYIMQLLIENLYEILSSIKAFVAIYAIKVYN